MKKILVTRVVRVVETVEVEDAIFEKMCQDTQEGYHETVCLVDRLESEKDWNIEYVETEDEECLWED